MTPPSIWLTPHSRFDGRRWSPAQTLASRDLFQSLHLAQRVFKPGKRPLFPAQRCKVLARVRSCAHSSEVPTASDNDAVLFSDKAEHVFQAEGPSAMHTRSAPAHERAIRTLRNWYIDVDVDGAMILGGLRGANSFASSNPTFL